MATSASEWEKKWQKDKEGAKVKANRGYDSYADALQGIAQTVKDNAAQARDAELDRQNREYRDQHDLAAAQEFLNRRKTNEAMANSGLSDSGLNRTQQTAISIARGNQDAALTRQQQDARDATFAAYDDLVAKYEAEMAEKKFANEQARQAALLEIDNDYDNKVAAMYKAEAEAKQAAAKQAAENQKMLQDAYLAILKQTNGDTAQADQVMQKLYGVSLSGGQAQTGTGAEQTRTQDNTPLANRTWYRTKITLNSGLNTALGLIDDNDMVTDEFGNAMTMRQLYNALIEGGQMDAKSAKNYILSLQKQNAGRYDNGKGYTAKLDISQRPLFGMDDDRHRKMIKSEMIRQGLSKEDVASDIMNYFYPYDTDAQRKALSEIGYSDKVIDALIKANAG